MEFSNTLLRVILLVIVLVVVAVPLRGFFYSEIMPFFKSDFSQQTPAIQNTVQNEFNAMAANINSCMSKTSSNCVCKNVIPDFPNTFYSNGKLKFSSLKAGTKLEYFWKEKTADFSYTFNDAVVLVLKADLTNSRTDLMFKEIKALEGLETGIAFSQKETYPKSASSSFFGIWGKDLFVISPHLYKIYPKQAVFISAQSSSIDDIKRVIDGIKECA